MDRIRDGRRGGGGVSVGGGPPPPPRRRLRSNGGGGGGGGSGGPRDSPRAERRRGERIMLNGGGGGGAGRDDGDDTSDESLPDDDDDAEEELAPRYQQQRRSPSTAPPPPSPPQPAGGHHHSSSSSGGGGGYHNHHHGQQHQMQRKGGGGSNPKSPIVVKAVDEMIGVPVPRKARSASTKRSSHEWPVPGGGTSGGSTAGAGDGSQILRPSSRPISPASASTTVPARKKLKPLGGGSSGGPGPAPKQRPSPSPAPSTTPPQPPPPKISKSPSFIQEEIEVAEVLFGLTRQFPCPPPPKQESNHKLEPRDAPEAKSGNSSPAPSSSGARPADSTSLSTIAPKRKRPRLVKYDEDSRPASPAKPELAEPASKPEPPPVARSEAKTATSVAAESGTSTAPAAAAQLETSREPEKTEDRGRNRDSELRPSESDRRDHRLESQGEPPAPSPASSVKPDAEAKPVGSEARNGEATATTKIELASDGARQDKKFSIDLMAPPPGKLSDDMDGSSDPDADKKGLDSEMDMLGRGNSEKKDGERTRRGLDIDLEDQKVQRIPADEFVPKKLTLQLDLEKPSPAEQKIPDFSSPRLGLNHPLVVQQQKPSKAEVKHEKSAMPAVTPPMPIPVGGWLGNFPPFGYLSPVPGLSAPGLHHPMDVKPGSSSGLQHAALLPPPTRSKRCATHCYIAQFIQHQQRVAKMNSFWPPAAAAAAAAAANRSGPFFGARPFGMGVVPPTDAASMLVNPMQGSYPVRAHTPMQEAKAPSMATSPFQGTLSKDKAPGNAAGAESSQRKQPPAQETQQSTPVPNMLQAPAFIFPFNQQHAMVAAANAANRAGDAKSSGASNSMPPSASAHTSAANSGAAAMNLSFANLQPADAQFLAILQNGYPFQVAPHPGGPPYRGMAPPGPAVPFFNGHVYSSPMMHPSQQQGAQPQSHQKNQMPNLPSSSQKHQPQQSQGLLGYAPNANAAAAASNLQNYSSGSQRPVLLPGLTHRQESDKTGQDGPSSDDKPSHSQKSVYEHNFAVPVHLPNFAMISAAQPAGNQSDKKLGDHHHQQQQQQQPQVSRGQGVRIDLASSQPFVMPFGGSIGPPGSAPTGLDFSALAQNHAVFHQEAARHGYPQLNFATAQSMQSSQHKPQHGETKSVAADSSSTPVAGDSERKKSTSTKYPGDSQQHSLSFTRTESKNYVPPFLGGSTNESSSRTLSLIGTESSNAFMGSKSTNSTTPASTPAAAPSSISQQHQQQMHFLQMQVQQKHQQHQQLIQHHHLNRPRSAAPRTQNSSDRYPDGLNIASFPNMMYPSSAAQGGVQSPQLKASSGRGTPSSTATTPPAAPPPNLIVMKNSSLHQQQAKVPMQALSTPGHQHQSSLSMNSSKMGPSVTNLSTGGGDLSRSSNAPVASGSPSNSVSKSTGGSPPATGNAKGVQQPVQLPSPQQQSAKNSASTSGSKSTPTNHFSMAMPSILGQQPNASPGSNAGSKQQSHMPPSSAKQQQFTQGHFFISNTYAPQAPGAGGTAALGLYQKRPGDKTQQQAPHQQNALSAAAGNNMKALHPSSGGFMHLAAATQSAGGVAHSHMSTAQLTFGAMPMPLKPSSDQKPAAGK